MYVVSVVRVHNLVDEVYKCCGLNYASQKRYVQVLAMIPVSVTLFRTGLFPDVIKMQVIMRS